MVAVASDLPLMTEVVRTSLVARDFEVITLAWPGDRATGLPDRVPRPDVGLLISDLRGWPALREGLSLITGAPLPWVVLTGVPRGPVWGAVLGVGARVVLPDSASCDVVSDVLDAVARGSMEVPPVERELLVNLWTELVSRHDLVVERIQLLTRREREVLVMLHAGDPVARIAQLLEVERATVRSQVRSVLRKLEVPSQLAAVAALESLLALGAMEQRELHT